MSINDCIYVDTSKIMYSNWPVHAKFRSLPGIDLLKSLSRFWDYAAGPAALQPCRFNLVDRSRTIRSPLSLSMLDFLEIPVRMSQPDGFSQLVDQRSRALLDHGRLKNQRLAVYYDSSIESQVMLAALLKNSGPSNTGITVLYTRNPLVDSEQLVRLAGTGVEWRSADTIEHYLGNPEFLFLGPQCGSMLVGLRTYENLTYHRSNLRLDQAYNPLQVFNIIQKRTAGNHVDQIFELLNVLANSSPVTIRSLYQYFWWLDFILNWQTDYLHAVSLAHPDRLKNIIFEDNYQMFYSTKEFQIWSMDYIEKNKFTVTADCYKPHLEYLAGQALTGRIGSTGRENNNDILYMFGKKRLLSLSSNLESLTLDQIPVDSANSLA